MASSSFYNTLRYHIVPPIFLVIFTTLAPLFVSLGNPKAKDSFFTLGSRFSWGFVAISFIWALLSQKIPGSKIFKGPPAPGTGCVPHYAANGVQYFLLTLVVFFAYVTLIDSGLCVQIYDEFGEIVNSLNISALIFCSWLLYKGHKHPDFPEPIDPKLPKLYLFYRGVEIHPTIFGADIKQWAICRVSMMMWSILVFAFAIASIQKNGEYNPGIFVTALLMNLYLLKGFIWETGYFFSIDILYDRAGYYLCWGSICWVQAFYAFNTYYLVAHPSQCNIFESITILILGLISLLLTYSVDHQKETFKASGGKCHIWGRPAETLAVNYKDAKGKVVKSNLLVSGWWGLARHLNYTFEIIHGLSWCLAAAHYGIIPFIYVFFLIGLLVHRTYRDDEKCLAKYGEGWKRYCRRVPYKLVPYIY